MKPLLYTQLIFIAVVFFSCNENKNPCSLSASILKDVAQTDSLIKLPEIRKRDELWNFNIYKEPSLISAQYETYRFIWHSAFDGIKVYRVEKRHDQCKVIIKSFAGEDTIPVVKEFYIAEERWNNIVDRLRDKGFWVYPSSIERNGLDGATWTLEGYKPKPDECTGKKYHRLMRWSPVDSNFVAMCNVLSTLGKP
jgi:hypothetical protein